MPEYQIVIYDARYPTNKDRAICLEAGLDHTNIEETREVALSYGESNCIVRQVIEGNQVIEEQLIEIVNSK